MEKVTHKFELNTRISKATDSESSRYALGSISCVPAKGKGAWLTATDGRILAIVKDEKATCPAPVLMPAEIATLAGKKPMKVELNGRWENAKGKFAGIGATGRFPACDKVVSPVPVGCIGVRIDAKLLAKLAEAISDNGADVLGVTIFVPTEESEIDAKGFSKSGLRVAGTAGIGVIMPLGFDDKRYTLDNEAKRYDDTLAAYCPDFAAGNTWTQPAPR